MRKTFESYGRKNIFYVVDKEYNYYRGEKISEHVLEFDSFGDGSCQHTPSMVSHPENLLDFLRSLSLALADDAEFMDKFSTSYIWPYTSISRETIDFYKGIKFVEGKKAFYSPQLMKVCRGESKQYDTRWKEVPSWADGTFPAIFKFISGGDDILRRIKCFVEINNYFDGGNGWLFDDLIKLDSKAGTWSDLHYAFTIIQSMVDVEHQKGFIKRAIGELREKIGKEKEV